MTILVVGPSVGMQGGISSQIKSLYGTRYYKDQTYFLASRSNKKFSYVRFLCVYIFFLLARRVRLVHLHSSHGGSLIRKVFALMIAKIFGVKVIFHIHSSTLLTTLKESYIYRWVFSIVNASDSIVVLSDYWREGFKDYIHSEQKITVIPNGLTIMDVDYSERSNTLCFAGKICKEKGVYELLSAFKEIRKLYPDWELILAGDVDDKEELSQLVSEIGHITYVGWLDKEDLIRVLSSAKLFVLPTHSESFGLAIFEAITLKLGVVVSRLDSLECLLPEKGIYYSRPLDSKNLHLTLEKAIESYESDSSFRQENYNWVVDRYSIDKVVDMHKSLHDSVLS